MPRSSFVLASLLALGATSTMWAKGRTTRITLTCQGLASPIELTSTVALDFHYGPWGGAFLDSSHPGHLAPPEGLRLCEVAFYAEFEEDRVRLAYVAYYAYNPRDRSAPGYIYLPGPRDPWYALNAGTMLRRDQDGAWQEASRPWGVELVQGAIARADHSTRRP